MSKIKVLFLYPNFESEFRIPLSITILSSILKKGGHIVDLFDTTFMTSTYNKDTELMEEKGLVEPTELDKYIEIKGWFTKNWRHKFKIFKKYFKDINIDIITLKM